MEKEDAMLDSIFEEVKQLEKSIAETDYELRTSASRLRNPVNAVL